MGRVFLPDISLHAVASDIDKCVIIAQDYRSRCGGFDHAGYALRMQAGDPRQATHIMNNKACVSADFFMLESETWFLPGPLAFKNEGDSH